MSSTTTDPSALTESQEQASRTFAERVCRRLADNLHMLLGREIGLSCGSVALEQAADLRLLVPAHGVVFRVPLQRDGDPVLAMMELPLARSLAHLAGMKPAAELDGVRDAPPPLEPGDLEHLATVAGFFASAVGEEWEDGDEGEQRNERPSDVVTIADSVWEAGQDPLGGGAWLHLGVSCKLGSGDGDPVRILVPRDLAVRMVKALSPDAEEDVPGPPPILCIGSPELAGHLREEFPDHDVELLDDVGALAVHLDAGRPGGVVIARISEGDEGAIRDLAQIKQSANALRGSPVMLLLESPVKSTVILCGRLGLVNALPSSVDPDVVARRIRPVLSGV